MRFNIQQGESNDVFHDSTALQDINVLEDVVLFYSFISFFFVKGEKSTLVRKIFGVLEKEISLFIYLLAFWL